MATIKQLDELIEQCERKLARAKRDVVTLEAELKGYRAAREGISRAGAERRLNRQGTGRSREVSDKWRAVLSFIAESGQDPASIDDIMSFIAEGQIDLNRNAVRSQLSIYTQNNVVERAAEGQYRITETGRQMIDEADGASADPS